MQKGCFITYVSASVCESVSGCVCMCVIAGEFTESTGSKAGQMKRPKDDKATLRAPLSEEKCHI